MSRDVFGTDVARVHLGKQNLSTLQVRKQKGLKRLQKAQGPVDE